MTSYPAPAFDALAFVGMVAIVAVVLPWAAWVFSPAAAGVDHHHNNSSPAQARARRLRSSRLLCAWLLAAGLSAGLAASGWLARSDAKPPVLVLLVLLVQGVLWWQALGRHGAQVARNISLPALVLLQGFRLPLELLMLHAAQVGLMPLEFSMAGYNFDVITGALALPLAGYLWRSEQTSAKLTAKLHTLLWAWNLWGIVCLLVIVGLALATSPNLALFGSAPQHLSLWVLHFPYVWLPVLLVSVATYGHLLLTRRLLLQTQAHPEKEPQALPLAPPLTLPFTRPKPRPFTALRFPFTSRNGIR